MQSTGKCDLFPVRQNIITGSQVSVCNTSDNGSLHGESGKHDQSSVVSHAYQNHCPM